MGQFVCTLSAFDAHQTGITPLSSGRWIFSMVPVGVIDGVLHSFSYKRFFFHIIEEPVSPALILTIVSSIYLVLCNQLNATFLLPMLAAQASSNSSLLVLTLSFYKLKSAINYEPYVLTDAQWIRTNSHVWTNYPQVCRIFGGKCIPGLCWLTRL